MSASMGRWLCLSLSLCLVLKLSSCTSFLKISDTKDTVGLVETILQETREVFLRLEPEAVVPAFAIRQRRRSGQHEE